jgi:hypothetical protein
MSEPNGHLAFVGALGSFIIAFNVAERHLQRLASLLITPSPLSGRAIQVSQIVTVELGAISLEQVLSACSRHYAPDKGRNAIVHAMTYVSGIREYRNFYVHGIEGTLPIEKPQHAGYIDTLSAKHTLKQHRALIEQKDLEALEAHCVASTAYTKAVINFLLRRPGGLRFLIDRREHQRLHYLTHLPCQQDCRNRLAIFKNRSYRFNHLISDLQSRAAAPAATTTGAGESQGAAGCFVTYI